MGLFADTNSRHLNSQWWQARNPPSYNQQNNNYAASLIVYVTLLPDANNALTTTEDANEFDYDVHWTVESNFHLVKTLVTNNHHLLSI